jgi:hypothetical protein
MMPELHDFEDAGDDKNTYGNDRYVPALMEKEKCGQTPENLIEDTGSVQVEP